MGKHVDYAGGQSLVCAIERGFCVVAVPRTDATLRFVSSKGEVILGLTNVAAADDERRLHYPRTVAARLTKIFGPLRGADVAFVSDLPQAAGLSSSSALVIMTFFVLAAANRLTHRDDYRARIRDTADFAHFLGCLESGEAYKDWPGDVGVGTSGGRCDIVGDHADEVLEHGTPETTRLIAAARAAGATACRSFGTGFCGCVYAICREADAARIVAAFRDAGAVETVVGTPGPGAFEL